MADKPSIEKVNFYYKHLEHVKKEVWKVVVGQNTILESLLRCLISNGHALVEGVPGIAKTLLIKSLAIATGCKFSRIQFTVDLLPTDITGLTIYTKEAGFTTVKGPIFANFIVADEINRGTPKLQSALLEAMQEKQVTIGKETYKLPLPFFVMATQNPIESAGVYALPEAQLDRFLFKINMGYPSRNEEKDILLKNITTEEFESYKLKPVINPKMILEMQNFVKGIYVGPNIKEYIVRIVEATREKGFKLGKYLEYGASPRASISLFIASKADALLQGSNFVAPQNIKNVAYDILQHRILLNYEGLAENVKTHDIIKEILHKVPIP